MLLSNCVICNSKNSGFFKEQEVSRLLSSLGIKTILSKIYLVSPLFLGILTSYCKIWNENMSNQELIEELHKQIIRKFEKVQGADLVDMQLISTFNKRIYFYFVLLIFIANTPFKDKKGFTITDAFQKILDESNYKPQKMWVVNRFLNFSIEQ